jgi:hypothetical protein|tara:strand:- start:260 stop:1015 length:756 start_codon:yes stop_codon:yes gene_type:complete
MANKKFSQFELKTDQADVDFLVGYTGTENVQIATEKVGLRYDLTGETTDPGNYVVKLTDNNGVVTDVTLVEGKNISLTDLGAVQPNAVRIDNIRGSVFTVTGTIRNIFGGDPGIFGDTVEFGIGASPASTSSSVLIIPVSVNLINISYKWIAQTALTGLAASDLYQIKVLPMSNTSGPTTGTGNYDTTIPPIAGLDLTDADNGTFPFKSAATNITLAAGSIINVSGVESSGNIPTKNAEVEVVLTFETYTF